MTWGATERTWGGLDLGALYGVERSFSISRKAVIDVSSSWTSAWGGGGQLHGIFVVTSMLGGPDFRREGGGDLNGMIYT